MYRRWSSNASAIVSRTAASSSVRYRRSTIPAGGSAVSGGRLARSILNRSTVAYDWKPRRSSSWRFAVFTCDA